MITIAGFESAGATVGVGAFESVGMPDWGGLIVRSFDTTNAPDRGGEWPAHETPECDADVTLREITDRYDNLFRRLAD